MPKENSLHKFLLYFIRIKRQKGYSRRGRIGNNCLPEMGLLMKDHVAGDRERKGLALFLIVGTGCLLAMLWRQNHLLKQMTETSTSYLVELGFQGSNTVEYMKQQQDVSKEYAWLVDSIPVFSYLTGDVVENAPLRNKNIEGLALLYPGKSSTNPFWSGASSEKSMGRKIFQLAGGREENQEESVPASVQFDDQKASEMEAAALEENEAFREEIQGEQNTVVPQQDENLTDSKERILANQKKIKQLKSTQSLSYLLKNFYIVDSSTSIDKKVFDVESLLNTKLTMKKKDEPQILIFHTHGASERFADSNPNDKKESIVGVGSALAEILEKKYGYQVLHDETEYDRISGKIDRNKAYNQAYTGLQSTLKKYPSIQVIIDLHRDGVGDKVRRVTTINGKKMAQVMFFNGLSRNKKGNIKYLNNQNLQSNLAFSLQMKLKCMELYSDFAKPVYLKGYRYNLHLRKRSMLIELGNQNNTVQEARNAMEPLAEVINQVLSGK